MYLASAVRGRVEEMTAGSPIGHFEIEYAASLTLPADRVLFPGRERELLRARSWNSCNLPSRSDGNFLARDWKAITAEYITGRR